MNKLIPDKPLRACVTTVSLLLGLSAQPRQVEKYDILPTQPRQHIQHFGASDAWSMRFIGLWPEWQQNQVADWLFSTENDAEGKPKGIGLSIWRFNLGAGSAEQGDSSHINYPTRTECVLRSDGSYDWSRQAGNDTFSNSLSGGACHTSSPSATQHPYISPRTDLPPIQGAIHAQTQTG